MNRSLIFAVLAAAGILSAAFFGTRANTLDKENRSLLGQNQTLEVRVQELEIKAAEAEAMKKTLDELRAENDKLKADVDKLKKEVEEKVYLEDMLIAKAKELAQMRTESKPVDLGSIQVAPGAPQTAPAAAQPAQTLPPRKAKEAGRVLAVNEEHGFVVVDFGKVDGVSTATQFALKKQGKVVGTLKAIEIRDVMTACDIKDLVTGVKVEVNDLVAVRK